MKEPRFPNGHYSSPIPNPDELDYSQWENVFDGLLDINDVDCLANMELLCGFVPELQDIEFDWGNAMYPPADALTYYGFIRHLQPSRIIEIGSGYSSVIAEQALKKNGEGQLTCIEPYPPDVLRANESISVIEKRVQDVDVEVFGELQGSDILFIDSSHVCKTQSDLNTILFKILPGLGEGIYIHFHDIFLPSEYPAFWLRDERVFYNEQYVLLAYLMNNSHYKIILPNRYLLDRYEKRFIDLTKTLYERHIKVFRREREDAPNIIKGGSFWIQKVSAA